MIRRTALRSRMVVGEEEKEFAALFNTGVGKTHGQV